MSMKAKPISIYRLYPTCQRFNAINSIFTNQISYNIMHSVYNQHID